MVEGHEITPLMVVDLDGTLLRGNSLHVFAACLLRDSLRHLRLANAAKVAGWCILRGLRLCSHPSMKWGIINATADTDTLRADFAGRISAMLNPQVKNLIDYRREQGYAILLATAAADIYVPLIWDGPYVATRTADNPTHTECRGSQKLDAVTAYATKNQLRLDTIVTDHHDDMALLKAPFAERILVNPSQQTRRAVQEAQISIDSYLPD